MFHNDSTRKSQIGFRGAVGEEEEMGFIKALQRENWPSFFLTGETV